MGKADLSGVEMVLAGLTGDADNEDTNRASVAAKPAKEQLRSQRPQKDVKAAAETRPQLEEKGKRTARPKTRMGRPPGRKSGETPLKRKTTISISAELMDSFAERSWKERCQLGELVERALSYYRSNNWGREPR